MDLQAIDIRDYTGGNRDNGGEVFNHFVKLGT